MPEWLGEGDTPVVVVLSDPVKRLAWEKTVWEGNEPMAHKHPWDDCIVTYMNLVDFYGKYIGRYTKNPMDPMLWEFFRIQQLDTHDFGFQDHVMLVIFCGCSLHC